LKSTEEIKSIIKYLSKCYEADSRSNQLLSIFTTSIAYLKFVTDFDLFEGELDHYHVSSEYAKDLSTTLQLFVKEKEYKAFLITIKSKKNILGKVKYIYTPLFLYDAKPVTIDEYDFIEIDRDSLGVNPVAINIINNSPDLQAQEVIDLLKELSVDGVFNMGSIVRLEKLFSDQFDIVDCSGLKKYPEAASEAQTKRVRIKDAYSSVLILNAGFFMKTRTKGTQGVLTELSDLVEKESYNKAIESYLLGGAAIEVVKEEKKEISVPALLSVAQQKALNNLSVYNEIMIVGPPGTGKSYTISALAINEMYQGKSVLIVSSNPQAVAVIDEKLKKEFGIVYVTTRIGNSKKFKSLLVKRLGSWLSGRGMRRSEDMTGAIDVEKGNKIILESRITRIENELSEIEELEVMLGKYIIEGKLGLLKRFKKYRIKKSVLKLNNHADLYSYYLRNKSKLLESQKLLINLVFKKRLKDAIDADRKSFQDFRTGLKSKFSGEKLKIFENIDFENLTKVFPIWLAPINEVHNVLPLKKDIFDVVIFDEASQTDMASVLPLLYRAKKVVVVGDPKQLRHISFLSYAKQSSFSHELVLSGHLAQSFDYRNTSFLDQFNKQLRSQHQVAFLDEHYRSLPDIISFSNRYFYDSSLRIMRDKPSNYGVESQKLVGLNGVRHPDGENDEEANYIVFKCIEIINKERTKKGEYSTIGILSPFRAQIDYITQKIKLLIDAKDLVQHKVTLGTAHAFQGDEKDIMFISFCVDDAAHHASFMHLNKDGIFNVSLTRAKKMQYLVHSIVNPRELKEDSNLKALLEDDYKMKLAADQVSVRSEVFIVSAIVDWIQSLGFEVDLEAQVAGVAIDLLVKDKEGNFFGIDLVGVPSSMGLQLSFDKIRILNNLELKVFPISVSDFVYNKENLEKALIEYVKYKSV